MIKEQSLTLEQAKTFASTRSDIASGIAKVVSAGIEVHVIPSVASKTLKTRSPRMTRFMNMINTEAYFGIGVGAPDRAFSEEMEP